MRMVGSVIRIVFLLYCRQLLPVSLRGIGNAVHACGGRRHGLVAGGRYGNGMRHDPQAGDIEGRLASCHAAARIGDRPDLRAYGHRRDGGGEPVRASRTWCHARHRCGNRDLTSVQSELFLLAALFLLLGFAVDLAHRALDPRLKSAGVGSQEVSA